MWKVLAFDAASQRLRIAIHRLDSATQEKEDFEQSKGNRLEQRRAVSPNIECSVPNSIESSTLAEFQVGKAIAQGVAETHFSWLPWRAASRPSI
jgi:hypothetical protein